MEFSITKESDEVSTILHIERHNEPCNIKNKNDNNLVDTENTIVTIVDQVNNDKKADVLNFISKCPDDQNASFDSELVVQNILFDIKSDEISSKNAVEKTSVHCNIEPYSSDDKNVSLCLPMSTFNETQVLLNSDEAIYPDINNTFIVNKKRGFSIEEISKDETSQSSQIMSTYSNDYTCFLSEQTDVISNLTPFKRSNSYYFDSPVKKLCTIKPNNENINEVSNSTLYSNENDNKIYTGFTSIQNDLEVDCIQDRYDGSDSGFGSELAEEKNSTSLDVAVSTSSVSCKNDFTLNQESSFEDLQRTSNEFLSAMEVLKPKFTDSVLDANSLEICNSYGIVKGILKRNRPMNYGALTSEETIVKKRRNINFANVTVFYFPRVQGFTCVPSQVIIFNYKLITYY